MWVVLTTVSLNAEPNAHFPPNILIHPHTIPSQKLFKKAFDPTVLSNVQITHSNVQYKALLYAVRRWSDVFTKFTIETVG